MEKSAPLITYPDHLQYQIILMVFALIEHRLRSLKHDNTVKSCIAPSSLYNPNPRDLRVCSDLNPAMDMHPSSLGYSNFAARTSLRTDSPPPTPPLYHCSWSLEINSSAAIVLPNKETAIRCISLLFTTIRFVSLLHPYLCNQSLHWCV